MSNLKEVKSKSLLVNSVSKTEGGVDIRVSVRQIENGFIITKTTEGKDKKGNWKYESKDFYSETNPLEIKTEEKSLAELFTQ